MVSPAMDVILTGMMKTATPSSKITPHPAINHRGDDPGPFFQEQGFYVLHDGLSRDDVEQVNREVAALCRGERGGFGGQLEHDPGSTDEQVIREYLCIHFPHKASALMAGMMSHPRIVDVLTSVIGPNVKAMQSMLFIKAAGKPGQAWHQDEDYIPTRDRSLCGAWIALDDATVDNGCLWVIPGSHKPGVLWPMEVQNDPRFDCADESQGFPYSDADAVPVEVPAGSVVFFNGYTLHRSLPNRKTEGFRRSLVNHYMSAESLLPWFGPENIPGTVAMADCRDIMLVAGTDPYAYKGTQNVKQPHVRPSGEGGCDKGTTPIAETVKTSR